MYLGMVSTCDLRAVAVRMVRSSFFVRLVLMKLIGMSLKSKKVVHTSEASKK
jgi:hypothetical protein